MTATNEVASCASMSVPTAGQKRLVIVGATGIVGNVVRPEFHIGRVMPQNSEHQLIFADRRDLKRRPKRRWDSCLAQKNQRLQISALVTRAVLTSASSWSGT